MPEGTSLEQTLRVLDDLSDYAIKIEEVKILRFMPAIALLSTLMNWFVNIICVKPLIR
jgi:hypothetical protein